MADNIDRDWRENKNWLISTVKRNEEVLKSQGIILNQLQVESAKALGHMTVMKELLDSRSSRNGIQSSREKEISNKLIDLLKAFLIAIVTAVVTITTAYISGVFSIPI